jgi:hypothetical protein
MRHTRGKRKRESADYGLSHGFHSTFQLFGAPGVPVLKLQWIINDKG